MRQQPWVPEHIRRQVQRRTRALYEARVACGYSGKRAARLAGIGEATLSALENGAHDPLLDRYLRAHFVLIHPGDDSLAGPGLAGVVEQEVARWRTVLRESREKAGLSQLAAGEKAYMAQTGVSRVEIGGHTPKLSTMLRLAEVVGADV